jgi:hypothetical protein
MTKISMSYT